MDINLNRSLTFVELLNMAEKSYGSNGILTLGNSRNLEYGFLLHEPSGDNLADFICDELYENFESTAMKSDQLDEACRVLNSAVNQLNHIIMTLEPE